MLDRCAAGITRARRLAARAVDATMGLDGYDGDGAADCVCEHRQFAARPRYRSAKRDRGAAGDGGDAWTYRVSTVDRDFVALYPGRDFGIGAGVLGGQGADGDLSPVGLRRFEYLHQPRFSDFVVYAGGDRYYRCDIWLGARVAGYAARRGENVKRSGGSGAG